jgi:hypothetical protein
VSLLVKILSKLSREDEGKWRRGEEEKRRVKSN